jgi:hypothetical protein
VVIGSRIILRLNQGRPRRRPSAPAIGSRHPNRGRFDQQAGSIVESPGDDELAAKLLPPRINAPSGIKKTAVPEGLWIKCTACEAVLYRTD